jgi:beta-mannanase
MAILHAYTLFDAPPSLSTLNAIDANGSIPLVDWSCANVDGVVSGYHDASIKAYAQTLKTFGKPVFLRWYWEMNQDNAAREKCGGYHHGQDFIAAWKRIWDVFHSTGAANVAFVWCPSANGDASAYYPGDAYVDWVGADRYDRTMLGGGGFDYLFGEFYAQWSPHNKPMMVGETAATAPDQWRYLTGMLRAVPARYPLIKAVIYFDAPSVNGSWPLENGGRDAFRTLANSSYFAVP